MEEAQKVLDAVKSRAAAADVSVDSPFLSIATATRYLRGYLTVSKAAKQMFSTLQYRQLVKADKAGTDQQSYNTVWNELNKRLMFIGAARDNGNPSSPVLVMRKSSEPFDKDTAEEYRQGFFFTLDCTAKIADRELGIENPLLQQTGQWVLVMDMAGYSSKNSPPFSVSMETMRIFQNHFPERAKRIIVLDAPAVFNALWKVLRPFIDPVTRPKFVFLSRSMGEEALKAEVGEVVWECINVDLEEGKRRSCQLMVDAGFLRPKDS